MNTSIKITAIILSVFALTGCNEEKIASPDIYNVGTYEGCDVKYIDRGMPSRNFFIAKCPTTETVSVTGVPYAKSGETRASIRISAASDAQPVDPKQQQIQQLEQQLQQLQSQLNDMKKP